MRRAARTDDNQEAIVDALRACGCSVAVTSMVGSGFPDIIVYSPFKRELLLMEVKDGAKSPSRRKLTRDQEIFRAEWKGPVSIVNSVSEALLVAGVFSKNDIRLLTKRRVES